MGKSWENHGKTWETMGKTIELASWKNHRTMAEGFQQAMELITGRLFVGMGWKPAAVTSKRDFLDVNLQQLYLYKAYTYWSMAVCAFAIRRSAFPYMLWREKTMIWWVGSVDGKIDCKEPRVAKMPVQSTSTSSNSGHKSRWRGLKCWVYPFLRRSLYPQNQSRRHAFHPGIGGTFCTFQMEFGGAGRLWKPCPPKAGSGNSSTESMLKMFRDRVFIALARRGWWKKKRNLWAGKRTRDRWDRWIVKRC